MIKIKKGKHSIICISLLADIGLVFLTFFCYALGWLNGSIKKFDRIEFLIFCAVALGGTALIVTIALLLILCNKKYYKFTEDGIRYYHGNELIFELIKDDIKDISYARFIWALLLQFGAGYLQIEYVGDENVVPTMSSQNKKLYFISMSKKDIIRVSKLMKLSIRIK